MLLSHNVPSTPHIAYLTGGVLIRTVGSGSRSGAHDVSNSVVGCQMIRKKAFELCCHISAFYRSASPTSVI